MPTAGAYSREHCPRVYAIFRPGLGWAQTKTGQEPTGTRKQAVSPFALMMLQLDSLDLNAWHSRAFPFLVAKHCSGHSFQLRDYPLPTVELIPELQQLMIVLLLFLQKQNLYLCHCPRQIFTNVRGLPSPFSKTVIYSVEVWTCKIWHFSWVQSTMNMKTW